jgi:Flp pilus assembly protein TadB
MELAAIVILIVLFFIRSAKCSSMRQRELVRLFTTDRSHPGALSSFDRLFGVIAQGFFGDEGETLQFVKDSQMDLKLRAAGFDSGANKTVLIALRILACVSWLLAVISAWKNMPRHYTLVVAICGLIGLVWLHNLYVNRLTATRRLLINRELPLLVNLVNTGISIGWNVPTAIGRVTDALVKEYPFHPLIGELKRACWLTTTGYTWPEALERVERRICEDSVSRTCRAFALSLLKGGDRSGQLEKTAEDAWRNYASAVDRQLMAVPVQAFMVIFLLCLVSLALLIFPGAIGQGGGVSIFL